MTAYRIRSLDKMIDAKIFCCGQPALDDYIAHYASQDERRGIARVFVATPESDARCLAGFFTLSAGSVDCCELPVTLSRKLPRYPVPIALLGRLAVDRRYSGKGAWLDSVGRCLP